MTINAEWYAFLQNYQATIANDEVVDFGDPVQELQAVLQAEVIADLSHFAVISVCGQDAEKFLQGQLTCDIREVNANQNRLSAYCNLKGRVVATCRVFKYHEDYYLLLPRTMQHSMLAQLKKYALFSKVSIQPFAEWVALGCAGANIREKIGGLTGAVPATLESTSSLPEGIIINLSYTAPQFILLVPPTAAINLWRQLARQLKPVGADAWRLLDILAGIATVYPATRELFTPQMLDYPKWHAVSFTKGCYLGQEIVARTEYLGKTKRRLCHAHTLAAERPAPGAKLLYSATQQEAGIVVEAVPWPPGGYKLLAVVMEEIILTGKDITLNGQEVKLELLEN